MCHALLHLFPSHPFHQFEGKKGFGNAKAQSWRGLQEKAGDAFPPSIRQFGPTEAAGFTAHCLWAATTHRHQPLVVWSQFQASAKTKVLGLSLLKSQNLVQIRWRSFSAHLGGQHWETRTWHKPASCFASLTTSHTSDYPLVAVAWRGGCAQELAAEVPAGSTGKAEQRVSHHLAKPLCESQLSSVCSLQGQEGRFLMTSTLVP